MVKKTVTLLEETIFQHVTIHKLIIYLYNKIKMSQDPLLAVIRTNISELKNKARDDPSVMIASSKTVLKTLLNFTRLNCISKETVCFIRRLMHDVYARMKRLWEIYKAHGSYELPKGKRLRISNKVVDKENLESKNRQLKITIKRNSFEKKVSEINNIDEPIITDANNSIIKDSNNIAEEIADKVNNSITNECTEIESMMTMGVCDNNQTIESNQNTANVTTKTTPGKSPKKRKIKRWSLGNFSKARKKKKNDSANKTSPKTSSPESKVNVKSKSTVINVDDTPVPTTVVPEAEPITAPVPEFLTPPQPTLPVVETVKPVEPIIADDEKPTVNDIIIPTKQIAYEELLFDKSNSIVKDGGWGERLRIQREYYLNEMCKVVQKLSINERSLPKYDFINKLTNKLGVTLTTYGYSLKELMAMDHANLVKSPGSPEAALPSHTDWTKMESSTSAIVSIFKATRCKKRFVYECLAEGCTLKTTQLQHLHNHASIHHIPFEWNWSCSLCGSIEVNFLRSADLLDMAMYHLSAFHSSSALNRNPVELEFTSLELQLRSKINLDSPVPTEKNVNYYSKLYKCSKCNFSTVLLSEAYSHFYHELNEVKELNCIYCLKSYITVESLCDHLEIYHGSSIFLCSECHYRSISFYNTLNHFYDDHDELDENKEIIIYINNPPIVAKDLSPRYYPFDQLSKYVCAHPDNDNYYTLVGSKFVKHIVNCQLRSGSGKRFECSLCEHKVNASYKLRQHYETHQVTKYICTYCGQGIAKLPAIKEHLYKVHMNWHPRFIIREAFDECPEEICTQYTSIMRYETFLEDLIEVSLEMDDFQKESARIKLKMVSGESPKYDNLLDQLNDIYSKTKPETIPLVPGSFEISNTEENPEHRIKTQISESLESSHEDGFLVISSDSEDVNSNQHYPESHYLDSIQYIEEDPLKQMDISAPSTSSAGFILPSFVKTPGVKSLNDLVADQTNSIVSSLSTVSIVIPLASQISDSPASPVSPSISPQITDQPRQPEIRVIAAAKMDNFRKSLPGVDDLVNVPKDDFHNESGPSRLSLDESDIKSLRTKTVPRILCHYVDKPKKRMIQICNAKKNFDNIGYVIVRCPFCEFAEGCSIKQSKLTLSQHLSRNHVDVLNFYPEAQAKRIFECVKCSYTFEAFAALHKHFETDHSADKCGSFKIYLRGKQYVRKNIKICFLCSALIVSLEELYKHTDSCPFAHTTGTPLNSSIVYAADKEDKIYYTYEKSDIKVNKSIVELLQPHLPSTSTAANIDVTPIKRAVAKKSTGPRPLPVESIDVSTKKRAVAKKSTGPYVVKLN
ncbi:hypothetical protein O3M35_003081 [Rhynocoris fuscipes]|uniref:C2H2-type domain-containing protein n=1 Tax=Rhynocoris fuscipes TaxID=488301 RepID=A0AAW1CQD3_9HEMI